MRFSSNSSQRSSVACNSSRLRASRALACAALERKLADPQLYGRDRAGFDAATVRLEAARHALAAAEERWLELEEKRESLAGTGTGTGR